MLQYGLSEGYPPLRETMKRHLETVEHISFEKNELFIVSGGQQCADLITKVLVNEGDTVLVEEPSFVGCLNTFRSVSYTHLPLPDLQPGAAPPGKRTLLRGGTQLRHCRAGLCPSAAAQPDAREAARRQQRDGGGAPPLS